MSTRKIYPYLIVFGWVFPLIIPIITIIITNAYYVDETKHCFLNTERGVIWSFIAPVLIILIINVIFLVIAIAKIIYTKWSNQNNEHKDVVKDALITALVLTPVLGIPWLFLILNISIQHISLEFIFIFLNGLIGLVFLLVVVLRNKEVHALLCRRRKAAGTDQTPSGPVSSTTASSQISSKFKKQGAGVSTLERKMVKEVDIEGGATNECKYSMLHYYYFRYYIMSYSIEIEATIFTIRTCVYLNSYAILIINSSFAILIINPFDIWL